MVNAAGKYGNTVHILGAISLLASISFGQAPAKPEPDVLEFNDGEKLIGHLVGGAGAKLTFHSDAAGDVTVDWASVKSLKSSGKFAVPQKGTVLDRHTDLSKVPQGSISLNDKKLEVDPGAGAAPTVMPVTNAANVVPEASFMGAFKTPGLTHDWHGTAGLGLDFISATQKSRNITAGVSLQRVVSSESWVSPRYKTLVNFNLADGQLSQVGKPTITTNLIHGGIEHDMFLSDKLFAFVSGDFLHSVSQGMKIQQSYAGGVGYVLLRTDRQELDVKGGIAYTRQSFESTTLADGAIYTPADKSLVGASLGETYSRSFKGGIALHEGFTFIPSFNDSSYYSDSSYLNLSIPVHKRINITIGGIDSYINVPPPGGGFKKNSFEFITQLSYKIN